MGYTHYWRGSESTIIETEWDEAIQDCQKIIENNKSDYELDFNGATPENLWFNGNPVGDKGYETFVIPCDAKTMFESDLDFCKTAAKPYDDVVTACLARLAEAGLSVSSDRNQAEWQDGVDLASLTLGKTVTNPI